MKRISSAMGWVVILVTVATGQDARPSSPSFLKTSLSRLPINFVENRGLYPEEVHYYVQGADKTLLFTRSGITFRLRGKDRGWVVKLDFVGVNPDVMPLGEEKQQAVFSYFKGPEKEWKTGLPSYAEILYEDLWPGIDLVYRGTVNELKYEFVVKPGADPGRIRLQYKGAASVVLTEAGALKVETPEGGFEDAPPRAYQLVGGRQTEVAMAYALDEGGTARFGFQIGAYDRTRPLVLDPAILVYCGYVGGSSVDFGKSVAVDKAGNLYVTGNTQSSEQTFPVKVGPDLTYNAGNAAYVAKVNSQGTALVYCGYIDGSASDTGQGIAVDTAGNAYVTGRVQSNEQSFPVKVGPDLTHNGSLDCYVAKVNAQGTGLVYCGYIGGSSSDYSDSIAVDAAGNVYVAGYTKSTQQTFPVKVGPDLIHNGNDDVFVAKVNATGSALVYCGYIGGSLNDRGGSIGVDGSGNAYVGGWAASNEQTFPVMVGPDLTHNGGFDAFVAKVDPKGARLLYCGYIGGVNTDLCRGIAVDQAGHAYVSGETQSDQNTFPVTVGPDLIHNGRHDAYVARVNLQGTALSYCGYVGGAGVDIAYGIAVDTAGSAYLTGETQSDQVTFPVKVGPDLTFNGLFDAFVVKVDPVGNSLVYCGYIGGANVDEGHAIAVDSLGNALVTGETRSDHLTFPVTRGPDLTYNGGSVDAFVAKVSFTLITATGAPRPGGKVVLSLTSLNDAGLPFQLGSSLGTGPIPIDSRRLNLSPDSLLIVTVNNYWPSIFSGFRGMFDAKGLAGAAIHVPNITALIGIRINTAFVSLDPAAPSGIRTVSSTYSFTIAK